MKHKHADVIKAWADGVPCQMRLTNGEWVSFIPIHPQMELRIKPVSPRDEQTDNHSGICLEVEA